MSEISLFLGIDGGGSKTVAVLTDREGRVINTCTAGGSNPNDIGAIASVELLSELIRKTAADYLINEDMYIFAGTSGALNNIKALTAGLVANFPKAHIGVNTDAVNMISSEIPDGDGACVISGTGSVCFMRSGDIMTRIGGWGYLIDSGGNGYTIGRDGIEAALAFYDGRGPATVLYSLIEERAGAPVEELITRIYSQGKAYIASFAPLVFECMRGGDRVASEIIERNADAIALMLDAAYKVAGRPFTAVMGGGINTHFAPEWEEIIKSHTDAPITLTVAEMPPVFGAVTEALKLADIKCNEEIRKTFTESYR